MAAPSVNPRSRRLALEEDLKLKLEAARAKYLSATILLSREQASDGSAGVTERIQAAERERQISLRRYAQALAAFNHLILHGKNPAEASE